MEREQIDLILEKQRDYFSSGNTLNPANRIANLKKLREVIMSHEADLVAAMKSDFGKPEFETVATETGLVLKELTHIISRVKGWSGSRRVPTPLLHFPASSYIRPQPLGQVLILSPWNFPFMLAFMPLVGAIAAGNCVVLKTSAQVPAVTASIKRILSFFPEELVVLIEGDHSTADYLLEYKFDHIFFTGSTSVGRHVAMKAAQNLIPVTLELGGKSPCVVASDANIRFAARRIAWGKFLNCGQACIAPDYLLVSSGVIDAFMEALKGEIKNFYGDNPGLSNDLARVINKTKAARFKELMSEGRIETGGVAEPDACFVAPTVITGVNRESAIMKEEIFGPVLPVIEFNNIEEVLDIINLNPNPLAAYIFTGNRRQASWFLSRVRSGTAAVNDTVMQIGSSFLPFGGTGNSGMGRYHGKKSFEIFSNMRPVLVKSNLLDITLRYPPYSAFKTKIIRLFMR